MNIFSRIGAAIGITVTKELENCPRLINPTDSVSAYLNNFW